MRLVVDLQSAQSGSRHGGIGRYSMDLLKGMIRQSGEHDIHVVTNNLFPVQVNEVRAALRNYIDPTNIHSFNVAGPLDYINSNIALIDAAEAERELFIRGLNPDAVHTTSLFEGFLENVVTSIHKIEGGPPEVVTLYDLIPHAQRELYLRDHSARTHYYRKIRELRRADGLLAISDFSANEFISYYGAGNRVITDIKAGIDPQFKKLNDAESRAEYLDLFSKISGEYILYTSSFDSRKNQKGLIEAYGLLSPHLRRKYKLVIAGKGSPQVYNELFAHGQRFNVRPSQVIFTGRVTDEELVLLYNLCSLFVFPSHWEGLGMPILEALSCGATVLASNTTSMPEVLGNRDGLFDPTDTKAMAEKIEQALVDTEFRKSLRSHVETHLPEFTWDRAAQRAWGAIEEVVQKARYSNPNHEISSAVAIRSVCHVEDLLDRDLSSVSRVVGLNENYATLPKLNVRRKIGWVTTWGIRCGIASYSERFIQTFPTEVTVFATDAEPLHETTNVEVVRCWTQGKSDNLDHLASAIEENNITDIVIQFNYGFFDFHALNILVHRAVLSGRRVFFVLHSTVDQLPGERMSLRYLAPSLAAASALFVHSFNDVKRLADLSIVDGVTIVTDGAVEKLISNPSVTPSRRTVATYGFALPGKGLENVIEAARILRERGEDIRFQMYNADYRDASGISAGCIMNVRELIARYKLDDVVFFDTSFREDSDSIELLRKADIIIYPYTKTGESSSAAIRMGLHAQRPVGITPIDIFDDVRDFVHTFEGTSPKELADGICKLLLDVEREDPEVASRLAASSRWMQVSSVRKVSSLMNRTMLQSASAQWWVTAIEPEISEIPVENGVFKDGAIRACRPGIICYGPYHTLERGLYRLNVRLALDDGDDGGDFRIRVTANGSTELIAEYVLDVGEDGSDASFLFFLPDPKYGCEVIFSSDSARGISIFSYKISKRYPY